jgi:hypothetical protein
VIDFERRRRWRQLELFKLCASAAEVKNTKYSNALSMPPEIFAERIRIQNLRFAHFLCAAQEMSGVPKS